MIRPTASWIRALVCAAVCAAVPACTGQNNSNSQGPIFGGLSSLTDNGAGSVTLSWTAAIEPTGGPVTYNAYGCVGSTSTNSGQEVFLDSITSATSITITGLTHPDPWIFYVIAVDQNGVTDGNNPPHEVGISLGP